MQALHALIAKDGFRLRGTGMSRVDGFSDVVFGFALTLIVVSLEVPRTYAEFHDVMIGFFPFFVCFVFFFMIWWAHFRFFRRYGLHDIGTIFINMALLFTTLLYAYPMKFLFTIAIRHVDEKVFTSAGQIRELMTIYSLGFAAVYACVVALYWNALRQKRELDLNPLEVTLTKVYIWDDVGTVLVGLLVCLGAQVLPAASSSKAAFLFFLIGVWKTAHGFITRPRVKAARARTSPEQMTAIPYCH